MESEKGSGMKSAVKSKSLMESEKFCVIREVERNEKCGGIREVRGVNEEWWNPRFEGEWMKSGGIRGSKGSG